LPLIPTIPTTCLRRQRLLIVGCGDVGLRVARLLSGRMRVIALTSSPGRIAELRHASVRPLQGDLDRRATLSRLSGIADRVLHLAPPPTQGNTDPRTANLLRALAARSPPQCIVYGSTSGVYGDCGGARIDETRATSPLSARARRRVDAERWLRAFGRRGTSRVNILRIPGIYALDRAGGDPRDRLRRGDPLLLPDDDVYTNHIHADDLARACVAALFRGAPQRVYHTSDDTQLRMGEHFDRVAELAGLPKPPRISRAAAAAQMSPMQMSFMSESRRLSNHRLKQELKLRLRYPTVEAALLKT
jgi:nucleoside-diphosphate-sugar epimerase